MLQRIPRDPATAGVSPVPGRRTRGRTADWRRRPGSRSAAGLLSPGQPLPSITELAREHGHARVTCGKAYRLLEAEGLVTRYPGLGYYVA